MAPGRALFMLSAMLTMAALVLPGCSGKSGRTEPDVGPGPVDVGSPAPPVQPDSMPQEPPDSDPHTTGSEPPDEMPPDAEPPRRVPAVPLRTMPGGPVPVRLQVGPRPIVLEASAIEPGDDLRVVVKDAETGEVVHEQPFTWTRATVTLATPSEDEDSPERWVPEPGRYVVELWLRSRQVGRREIEVE
jgi:hypothetical protein